MKKTILYMVLWMLLVPCAARAQQEIPVSAAVLPFESFSGEQKTELGRDVAVRLLQQLSENPLIVVPSPQDLQEVFDRDDVSSPSEDRLRELAKLLNVNFLLYGSVTKVNESLSIDAQVFYNFPGDHYFKTYADGSELDKVVQELAAKVEQEFLDKGSAVPAQLRPKVRVRKRLAPAAGAPDAAEYEKVVGRELAAEDDLDEAERRARKDGGAVEPEDLVEGVTDADGLDDDEPEDLEPPSGRRQPVAPSAKKSGRDRKGAGVTLKLDQPVNISSDSLEYNNQDNSAVFTGNVVARQGDIAMFADRMSVTYGGKGGDPAGGKGGIKQLVATGSVKIIQGDRIATGSQIVFYGDEQKIVATGNPRVWQGNNVIVGKKITVYLKDDRSVVEGNTHDRVSATIYPKEKKGK